MLGQVVGSLIVAGFGVVYVVVTTGSVPPGAQWSLLGAAISLCGVAALILAFAGAGLSIIDLVGGVTPGLLLLASALWGVQRRPVAAVAPHASPMAGRGDH